MEILEDTPIFKFNSNTLQEIRKELNLDQDSVLDQMIDNFEDWIAKQNHFTKKKFDRRYLEVSIVVRKGSIERAKKTLDKLCTLKSLLPQFFSKHDVKNEFVDTTGVIFQATMPRLLHTNYRLYIIKLVSCNFDSPNMLLDFQRFVILMSEYAKMCDYSLGFTCMVDCRDVNIINFITKVNILDLRNCLTVLIEGYGYRVNGIHLISNSKSIEVLVNLLKQILSAKLIGRIRVHQTIDSVYKHIPKEYMPEDYGGPEEPLKKVYENWVEELSTKKNVAYFKELFKSGTNEKHRLTSNFNEQVLGMPGSFRTLKLD